MAAAEIIAALGMARHPEGGWYAETFRDNPAGGRGHSTAIYFLLEKGDVSAWHRVRDAAEVWHHYAGAPLELDLFDEAQGAASFVLGTDWCRRAATGGGARQLLADGAQPGRLDAGRLHRVARLRLRAIRACRARLEA